MTIPHLAERTGGSAIRGFTVPPVERATRLLRLAVASEDLRRASDSAAEGFVEGNAAQLPAVWLALPFQPPLGGPAEILVAPDEVADQRDFTALLGSHGRKRCGRQGRQSG